MPLLPEEKRYDCSSHPREGDSTADAFVRGPEPVANERYADCQAGQAREPRGRCVQNLGDDHEDFFEVLVGGRGNEQPECDLSFFLLFRTIQRKKTSTKTGSEEATVVRVVLDYTAVLKKKTAVLLLPHGEEWW